MIDVFNTKSGDLVRFTAGNTSGYDLEEAVQHGLVEGKDYIVSFIAIGNRSTKVYLHGFEFGYNAAMFCNI